MPDTVPAIVYKNRDTGKHSIAKWTVLPDLPGPTNGSAVDHSKLADGWWAWEGDLYAYCPDDPDMGGGTYVRAHSFRVKDGKFQDARSPWYHFIDDMLHPIKSEGSILVEAPRNSDGVIAIIDHLGREWVKKLNEGD